MTLPEVVIVAEPIASVDTAAGHDCCTVNLRVPIEVINIQDESNTTIGFRTLIQAEYFISSGIDSLVSVTDGNGYIPPENISGILLADHLNEFHQTNATHFDLKVTVPNLSFGVVEPEQVVKFRLFVSEGPTILVTSWSNLLPVHNPPSKVTNLNAYLVRDDLVPDYNYADDLYVVFDQPGTNPYNLNTIKFIVTYSYIDNTSTKQWKMSDLLTASQRPGSSYLSVGPVSLGENQLKWGEKASVAVHATYPYTIDESGKNYFALSQISDTVQSSNATPTAIAPTLSFIVFPGDYHIYDDRRTQIVDLSYSISSESNIALPAYALDSYRLDVYVGTVTQEVIDEPENNVVPVYTQTVTGGSVSFDLNTITITPSVLDTSTKLSFQVVGISKSSDEYPSNLVTMNTFVPADAVTGLSVNWATEDDTGDVDLQVSFGVPDNFGTGTLEKYQLSYVNAIGAVVTQDITLVQNATSYIVYVNGVYNSGQVTVYAVTGGDSNTLVNQDGLYATASYTATSPPIIRNVSRTEADGLGFDVITATPLVRTLKLVSDSQEIDFLIAALPNTTVTDGIGTYTASVTPPVIPPVTPPDLLVTDAYRYTFQFPNDYLSNGGINTTSSIIIVISNSLAVETFSVPAVI